jgi:hypothetical protein
MWMKYFIIVLLLGLFSCEADETIKHSNSEKLSFLIGNWTKNSKYYYFSKGTKVNESEINYVDFVLNENQTGYETFPSTSQQNFNWYLQCNPDKIIRTPTNPVIGSASFIVYDVKEISKDKHIWSYSYRVDFVGSLFDSAYVEITLLRK